MANRFPRLNMKFSQTPITDQGSSTLVLHTLKDSESRCEAKAYMLHQNNITESANPGDMRIKIGERILIWKGSNKSWSSERIEDLKVIDSESIKDKYVFSGYSMIPDIKVQDVDKIHFSALNDSPVYSIDVICKPEEFWKDCIEENPDAVFSELNRVYNERARLVEDILFMEDLKEDLYESLLSKETSVRSYKTEFIDFIIKFFFTEDEINEFEASNDGDGIYEDHDPIDDPDDFKVDFILSIIKKLGGKSNIEKHLTKLTNEIYNLNSKIGKFDLKYRILAQKVKIPVLTKREYLRACGVIQIPQEGYLLKESNSLLDDWQFQSEDAILVNPGVQDACTSWVPNNNVNIIVDTYGHVYKYKPISEEIQCFANGETVEFEGPYIGSKGSFRKISEKILNKGSVKALRLGYDDYAKMLGCKYVAKTGHNKHGYEIFTIDTF
jgi:hypothetical protein